MGLFDTLEGWIGANGAPGAEASQAQGENAANNTLENAQIQQTGYAQPYYNAGTSSLAQMQNPNFQHSFSMADFQQDPGYQFQLQQGNEAINRAAAAQGLSGGGGTLKSLQSFSQGLASKDYQQAYNNYNNNQSLQFGRLASMAGMGQTASGQMINSSENAANQIAGNQMGLGNAQAAAQMAQANLNSQIFGTITSAGGVMAGSHIGGNGVSGGGDAAASGGASSGAVNGGAISAGGEEGASSAAALA